MGEGCDWCRGGESLLRIEAIGLNAWLASVGYRGYYRDGWHAQTVRHILIHCPLYTPSRLSLIHEARPTSYAHTARGAQAAARWQLAHPDRASATVPGGSEHQDTRPIPVQAIPGPRGMGVRLPPAGGSNGSKGRLAYRTPASRRPKACAAPRQETKVFL